MNRKSINTILSFIFVLVLVLVLVLLVPFASKVYAAESNEEDQTVPKITMKGNCITSVVFPEALTGTAYVSVYKADGKLVGSEMIQINNSDTIALSGKLAYDSEEEDIKVFLLDSEMTPLISPYLYSAGTYQGNKPIKLCNTYIEAPEIDGVSVTGTTLTISAPGEYRIEGTLEEGQIVVETPQKSDEVILYLTNVDVSSSIGNALDALRGKVVLSNTSGSTSSFTSTYSTEDDAGVGIYSKNDLTIKGEDSSTKLKAASTYGNAIRCKADIEIGAGDLEVVSGNNGIKGDESVKITKKAGTIIVNATGDAIKTDAIEDGILEYEKGNITVNGGTLKLFADGDGIQADDTITISGGSVTIEANCDGLKANTVNTVTYDDDKNVSNVEGNVIIKGGTIDITAKEDGIKAAGVVDISGGSIIIDAELDGIQSGVDYVDELNNTLYSKGDLSISGGIIEIKTGDGANAVRTDEDSHKGIKAYNALNISGGEFTIDSYDDAIHSNYTLTITGGSFEIATGDDGLHADYKLTLGIEGGSDDDYLVNISTSYEGIEGSVIEYLSGTTYLFSTDDGVNAAGDYSEDGVLHVDSFSQNVVQQSEVNTLNKAERPEGPGMDDSSMYGALYIKGGKLYVFAQGDGLDSNGDITMSGGIVLVNGPTSRGNGVFDKGDRGNVFTVTGGTLVGFGTTDMPDNPSIITNGSYSSNKAQLTKGTAIKVSTDTGYLIIVPEISLSKALIYVTCEDMTKGKTYSVSSVSSTAGATALLTKTVNGVTYGLLEVVNK